MMKKGERTALDMYLYQIGLHMRITQRESNRQKEVKK